MDKNNKKDIEYSVIDCLKKIHELLELKRKGQITPKDQFWLDKISKDFLNLAELIGRRNPKTKYPKHPIMIKSGGNNTWSHFFNMSLQLGFVEFIDVLRIRTKIYLENPDRGNQGLFIDRLHNILTSYDLGDIPDEYLKEAISEIPYNTTLNEIMEGFDKVPERTWDKLRPYSKDYIKTQSLPDDKTTDETDVSDFKTKKIIKNIIEDTTKYIIEDLIELERIYNVVLKISKEKLTDKQREVFEIKLPNPDMTFKEIEKILDIKESTARDRYNRAIKRLKEHFE